MVGDYKVRHFVVSDCISFIIFRENGTLIQTPIEEISRQTLRHLNSAGYVKEALVFE